MLALYWDRVGISDVNTIIGGSWSIYSHVFATGSEESYNTIIKALMGRHSKFTNVAFVDGHAAATMTVQDWQDLENSKNNSDTMKIGVTDKIHATIPLD